MLGCDIHSVDIVEGDTDRTPFGLGTFGSRTLLVVGIAITRAVDKVIAKGAKIAAHLMECDEKDVVFEAGRYTIVGTNQSVNFTEVVKAAYLVENYPEDLEPGLEETAFYDPPGRATTSGIHLCVVLVDPTDGTIRLRDYWSIDDVGRAINPLTARNQVEGAIVMGMGMGMFEETEYDSAGNIYNNNYADYIVPVHADIPDIEVELLDNPDYNFNEFGVRGIGEIGITGMAAAISNAVYHATGKRIRDMPIKIADLIASR